MFEATKSNPSTSVSGTDSGPAISSKNGKIVATENGLDIFLAAQYGDWQRLERLIESKEATASDKNEQGITPLHWAAINGRLLACKSLLDHGADVNAAGGDLNATPMMWAAKSGHPYIVHLLVTRGGDPNMVDNQGYNVLQLATHSSNIYLIVYLLHTGMAVDSTDPGGHTCLMWAAYQGDALSVNVFLKWGAAVNTTDQDGLNALHWSVVRGNKQCIQRIIEEGGDLAARQKEGKTARKLAEELKTLMAFESALSSVGRDPESSLLVQHWLSDDMSMKLIFLLPWIYLGILFKLFAVAPIMISAPVNAIMVYGFHRLGTSVITPPKMRGIGFQKTPHLAGIFSASALWTLIHWGAVILPAIGSSYPLTNIAFSVIFTLCLFHFFRAMTKNPGYLPKNHGGRTEQLLAIEELLRAGEFDNRHFCIECLSRKALRSKHCKVCHRCVARHDHHCPWINSCVGLRNHRDFTIYVVSLFFGIPLFVRLVLLYVAQHGPISDPVECTLLAECYCNWLQIDGFGILLAAWDSLQMTWVTMLMIVQLWQISRGSTTMEVYDRRRGVFNTKSAPIQQLVASAIVSGTTDTGMAGLEPQGQGPDPPHACHHHRHTHQGDSSVRKIARLFGIDQFFSNAKESLLSRQNPVIERNPYHGGLVSNCEDFWQKPPLDEIHSDGAGRLKGKPVDYYKLFEFPDSLVDET